MLRDQHRFLEELSRLDAASRAWPFVGLGRAASGEKQQHRRQTIFLAPPRRTNNGSRPIRRTAELEEGGKQMETRFGAEASMLQPAMWLNASFCDIIIALARTMSARLSRPTIWLFGAKSGNNLMIDLSSVREVRLRDDDCSSQRAARPRHLLCCARGGFTNGTESAEVPQAVGRIRSAAVCL